MKQYPMKYLNSELRFLQIAYKTQFTHFMNVFYFWTVLVTAPVTAGLLTKQDQSTLISTFPIVLVLIGIVGWLLFAKMSEIRMSQLTYISKMNYVRSEMHNIVKPHLSKEYKLPFKCEIDLSNEAKKDFGVVMTITMSLINAAYLGFGLPMFFSQLINSGLYIFFISFLFGIATYFIIIAWSGPKINRS